MPFFSQEAVCRIKIICLVACVPAEPVGRSLLIPTVRISEDFYYVSAIAPGSTFPGVEAVLVSRNIDAKVLTFPPIPINRSSPTERSIIRIQYQVMDLAMSDEVIDMLRGIIAVINEADRVVPWGARNSCLQPSSATRTGVIPKDRHMVFNAFGMSMPISGGSTGICPR